MKRVWLVAAASFCLSAMALPGADDPASGADWPQWGGPHRNFHSDATGIAPSWPSGGPRTLWSRALGEGYSSLVAADGSLYTMYRADGNEIVVALDADSGQTLWEHRYPAPLLEDMDYGTWLRQGGAGPYSTPLVAGDSLFAVGTTGKFHVFDRETGAIRWSHDLHEKFDMRGYHGYAASPLAYGDDVILPVGGPGRGVVAFERATGEVSWQSQDFRLAPASPILIDVGGQDQLVVFSFGDVVGLDPRNGAMLWSHPHETSYGLNISTPVWGEGNLLFVSSAYNGGSRVLRLTRSGETTSVEEVWFSNRLRLHFGNALRVGDLVFGTSGDFGPAFFAAVDVETGEELWRERTFGRSQMVRADGKLVVVDEDGDLALATASRDGLTVLARAELLTENAWTPPTLVGTTLYVRDRRNVVAVELGS